MKNFNQVIKDILAHYASVLGNVKVETILSKESIESEAEAKQILSFLDSMCDQVLIDSKAGISVLRQPIHTTDAEKVCDIMEDYIEEIGYEHLVDE